MASQFSTTEYVKNSDGTWRHISHERRGSESNANMVSAETMDEGGGGVGDGDDEMGGGEALE